MAGHQLGGDLSQLAWWEGQPELGPCWSPDGWFQHQREKQVERQAPVEGAGSQPLGLIPYSLFPLDQAQCQEGMRLGDLLSLAFTILGAIKPP